MNYPVVDTAASSWLWNKYCQQQENPSLIFSWTQKPPVLLLKNVLEGQWQLLWSGDTPLEQEVFHVEGDMNMLMGLWVTCSGARTPLRDCSRGWLTPGICALPSHWMGFDRFCAIHSRKKENRDWRWRRIRIYMKVDFFMCVFLFSIPNLLSGGFCLLAFQQISSKLDCFAHNSAGWSRLIELVVLRSQFHSQNSPLCSIWFEISMKAIFHICWVLLGNDEGSLCRKISAHEMKRNS